MARIEDFDFDLPPDRIAQVPPARRTDARLLVLRREPSGALEHRSIRDLPVLLDPGDRIVVNDSRVRPARIDGRRETGGRVEVLFVERGAGDVWTALVRAGGRLREGERLRLGSGHALALVAHDGEGAWRVRFEEGVDGEAVLAAHGRMPLPPYIAREADDPRDALDRERYQTVYADRLGSVAAPTAGLHLDEGLLAALGARGVERSRVTLHVGRGTFLPVRAERIEDHVMHEEQWEVSERAAREVLATRRRSGKIVAVGTTALRTLETAAGRETLAGSGRTDLFIRPPYRFGIVDALLTNFHLPRSTLLMLVAAFAGLEPVRAAYREAIAEGYRFYSYGDAMLVL